MATLSSSFSGWSSRIPVRYLGVYLMYLATFIRLVTQHEGEPAQGPMVFLLAIYGLLLIFERRLTRGRAWRPWGYLALQSTVVIGLLLVLPREEMVATLFVPLSLQAGLLLDRRSGFPWIAAFSLAAIPPVLGAFGLTPPGAAMVLWYVALYSLMGRVAYLIRRAESDRRENQRLIAELTVSHRQLQDYAAQKEEFVAAQERSRLARELHDSATQTVFTMNLTVQTARMLLERGPERVAEQLDRLRELAASAMSEIRTLADRLASPMAAPEALPVALRRLVAEREARDGLQIQLEVTGERDLPEPVVEGLCRIVREALNNIAKHAGTREAIVRLSLVGGGARLEIVDHGIGFDPGAVSTKRERLGLLGMAERARELGWRLSCDSRPGRGTHIRVEES